MLARCMAMFLVPVLAAAAAAAEAPRGGSVPSADGTVIRYTVRGAGDPAVVFVHCWSCDAGYWRHQADAFAADHRVVTVDLAGHGESDAGRDAYTIEAFARDVVAVLEAEAIDDAVLVGHSMGGPVAVEAALAAPGRVRGVIGVDNFQDMHLSIGQSRIALFIEAMRRDFAGTVVPWVRGMFPAGADTVLAAAVAADMASAPPEVGIDALAHTLAWMDRDGRERLPLLAVDLTTVAGDLLPTDVEGNRKLVPGFAVRTVAGTGHFPMLEKPAAFNAALAEAIAAMSGAGDD